ncbi:M56 family metallopeptidase [Chryseobacterium chendengshani]|uniref:M56 family metallopeptidase n=1 Tax=Chryseobacterium sp. LJ756 TaxID=2864113 RepID=UPI001C63DFDB|nr:M56 family metallopeptidase [Chryseobacterium sp. LJ756]MBW7674726.1 hypothetical protein [Chryseobacterium sp. LJ756]
MEALILYFGKVVICSGVMFLYYQLSLKDKTFHHYNRFYLLSAILVSILLPLISVDDFTIEVNNDVFVLINKIQNLNSDKTTDHDYIYFRIIFSALGLVSLYFLGKLLYGILKISQFKNQFQKETFEGVNFYQTNLSEAPFSYFKNLFWKNTIVINSDIGKQILKHEMVHIEQKHSYDKIFIEIITSVFWFNPFFHIIKREISLIHEYLADKKAVKQSDTKAFAQMLLASHFSGNQLPATSPFLSSNLKKRLKMLQKPQTKFGYARRILALPVLFTIAFAYMVNAKNKEITETNIEIEKAVSEIKKDTIRPEKTERVERIFRKSNENKKIADLSKKIEEKSKSLKNLKPESKEFEKNVEEIGKLSEEIGRISSSDEFLNSAMAFRMDGNDMKINEFFKSEDWKNNIKELKKMEIEMPDLSELDFDFPEAPLPPHAPNAPKAPKVKIYRYNDNADMQWSPELGSIYRPSERMKDSPEIAKKKAGLDRKRAKLNEKRAKLEGERAKIEAERRALEGNNRRVYIYNNTYGSIPTDKRLKINTNYIRSNSKDPIILGRDFKTIDTDSDHLKIYIDGKEVTKKEMDALNPNSIKNVNVNKTKNNGVSSGEIKIETK